jgi:hypothetical protein
MPINYRDYNPDFRQKSLELKILADWKCEFCGLEHKTTHPVTGKRVILSTMHLDQDKRNDNLNNLKVGCLGCHARYDAPFRTWNFIKRMRQKGQLYLKFAE